MLALPSWFGKVILHHTWYLMSPLRPLLALCSAQPFAHKAVFPGSGSFGRVGEGEGLHVVFRAGGSLVRYVFDPVGQ